MAQPSAAAGKPPFALQPGQQPTPAQIRQMQQQLAVEAQKAGLTVPQYVERLKAQALQQHQAQQAARAQPPPQAQQQQQLQAQQGQQVSIQPGPAKPEALAVANFLKSQALKPRTCILQEKRRDMFRVKRALRALLSPAYAAARAKNPLLPEVKDRVTAENAFKLLPLSLLALRVSQTDPHEGHAHGHAPGNSHGKAKRVKGLWTVRVEQQQEARDEYHYAWMYEGSQWRMKAYAALALAVILAVVFFPVWPLFLRVGVWYLSMGMLGLLGLFFGMAIVRLILFVVTMFAAPPGLWLYPNLFEDVGFFDSFRPVWAWQETPEEVKARKRAKKEKRLAKKGMVVGEKKGADRKITKPITAEAHNGSNGPSATGTDVGRTNGTVVPRRAQVEEVEDD